MCPDYTAFGITFDGAHAEYVRIPATAIAQGSVHPLPDGLLFAHASLVEPLSCVVNGNRAARIEMGDTVVVFGAGPIGLMHLMLARLSGAAKVIVFDVQTHRLNQAAALGASSTVNSAEEDLREHVLSETAGRGANVVITACAVPAVQEQSLGLLAPFGRVCFFGGLPKDGSLVRLDTNIVHYKQLLLTGVTGGSPSDFRTALTLIASGRINIEKIVSRSFPMTDLANAFDLALKGESLKIVLRQEETVGEAIKKRIDGMSDVSSSLITGLPAESEEAIIP
jgi:L-iditol 2-dehydrogenase